MTENFSFEEHLLDLDVLRSKISGKEARDKKNT